MVQLSDHYIVYFDKEDITKAQRIRAEENNIPGKQHFKYKYRWVGKLGEWAVDKAFPALVPTTQDYSAQKYDFYSRKTGNRYEVKTRCSKDFYKDYHEFLLNRKQHARSPADAYIACYYQLGSRELRIVGWVWREDVEDLGTLLKKGDLWKGKFPVLADRYGIPYRKLNGLGDFPG